MKAIGFDKPIHTYFTGLSLDRQHWNDPAREAMKKRVEEAQAISQKYVTAYEKTYSKPVPSEGIPETVLNDDNFKQNLHSLEQQAKE